MCCGVGCRRGMWLALLIFGLVSCTSFLVVTYGVTRGTTSSSRSKRKTQTSQMSHTFFRNRVSPRKRHTRLHESSHFAFSSIYATMWRYVARTRGLCCVVLCCACCVVLVVLCLLCCACCVVLCVPVIAPRHQSHTLIGLLAHPIGRRTFVAIRQVRPR